MTSFTIYSRGEEKCWLYSDDTNTLALSDCADPEMAQETTETTPQMLADCFSFDALLELYGSEPAAREDGKLATAIKLAAVMEVEIEVGYFNDEKELPTRVIARWDAADWDDEKMVARRYRYEDADTGSAIELTEEEAGRYSWGRCVDNLTGGSQAGER